MLLLSILLAASAPEAAAAPPAKAPKRICRYEQELGTRIPVRVCRTAEEMEEMERQAQADMRSSRNQRQIAPNP